MFYGGGHRSFGILRTSDIELDDEQVVGGPDSSGHGAGVPTSGDDGVPSGESRLHDVYAQTTARTSHEPDTLVSHSRVS